MSSSFYCLACERETVHRLCHKRVLDVGTWMHFPSQQHQYLTRRRMTRPVRRQATCRTCETTWAHLSNWPTSWENVRRQTTNNTNHDDDDDASEMKDVTDVQEALCKYTAAFRE